MPALAGEVRRVDKRMRSHGGKARPTQLWRISFGLYAWLDIVAVSDSAHMHSDHSV